MRRAAVILFILLISIAISTPGQAASAEVSGKLLDLGHISRIELLQNSGNRLLSRDSSGVWILWDVTDREQIIEGDSLYYDPSDRMYKMDYIELKESTLAVSTGSEVQIMSAIDGTSLADIPVNTRANTVGLSVDGSYFWAATNFSLSAWSLSGSQLVSVAGNYADAQVFADVESIRVAEGSAGSDVIETIPVDGGNPTLSPSFSGDFHSWFVDGSHFLTTISTVVYVYSPSAEQKALVDLQATKSLGGSRSYFWTHEKTPYLLKIYRIGSGPTPVEIFGTGVLHKVVPTINKIGVLPYGYNDFTIVHLDPGNITMTSHEGPGAYLEVFEADEDGSWFVGNRSGVIYDNLSSGLPLEDKSFGCGRIRSIAGSKSGVAAVATADGQILILNISDSGKSIDRRMSYDSSSLILTDSGDILAAQANFDDHQYSPDISLSILSLPTDNVIRKWEYSSDAAQPNFTGVFLFDFDLSLNGIVASRKEGAVNWAPYTNLVNIVESGELILSIRGDASTAPKLSPDGVGAAISDGRTVTTIYENGQLSAAISGGLAGWVDNERLLINTYVQDKWGSWIFVASHIYSRQGSLVFDSFLPEITSFTAISETEVFSHDHNAVFDLQTGDLIWTAEDSSVADAVGSDYVVYVKDEELWWHKWRTPDLVVSITLTSPNGGEVLSSGSIHAITWDTSGTGIHHVQLLYSIDSGSTYPNAIAASTENDGIYEWTVPMLDSTTVRIKVVAEDNSNSMLAEDASDTDFTIQSLMPAISDLSASSGTLGNTVALGWTAPENITTGCTYIVRYSTVEITEFNWDESSDVDGEPTPGPAGSVESMTVTVPYPGVMYYFAIKIRDEEQHTSDISNSPSAKATGIYLHAGWNLVSFIAPTVMSIEDAMSSLVGKYTSVWRYDTPTTSWMKHLANGPDFLCNLDEVGPGYGYWLYLTEDCTWDYGGAVLAPPAIAIRKPPFILYGTVTEDDRAATLCDRLSVSLRVRDVEAGSYTLGSNPRYGDHYVLEIPVDDSFHEGDVARIYVDGVPVQGEPINLGDIGVIRRYDISYTRVPEVTKLLQNYPNPFNPETWIPYQLAEDSEVTIRIYSVTGQLIKHLYLGYKEAGLYVTKDEAVYWDGATDTGECVSSGVYFYNIRAGNYSATRKMTITR